MKGGEGVREGRAACNEDTATKEDKEHMWKKKIELFKNYWLKGK